MSGCSRQQRPAEVRPGVVYDSAIMIDLSKKLLGFALDAGEVLAPLVQDHPEVEQDKRVTWVLLPLEPPLGDDIQRRIGEAAKYAPLENLALSPQCGFASTMEGNLLTEDEQWRKLELVREIAQKVWLDA